MATLIAKLDVLFLKKEKDCTYERYSHFDSITKDGTMSMADYIILYIIYSSVLQLDKKVQHDSSRCCVSF